jgi:glycosyl transferase family 25
MNIIKHYFIYITFFFKDINKMNVFVCVIGIITIIFIIILIILLVRHKLECFEGINKLDAILYINLENRPDRKELLLNELESVNTNMEKVQKVNGVFIPKNGHKGCVQSHIIALKLIKMNKWNNVLILEDDAEINIDPKIFNQIIEKAINILDKNDPDWNVIMLATVNKDSTHAYDLHDNPKLRLERLHRATTSSAYIIKNSYVDKLLTLFEHCNENMSPYNLSGDNHEYWALDQKWIQLQEQDNWYSFSTDLIKQRNIWSTIMQSHK